MFDRINSFEPALLRRPQTCLSTTLPANGARRASPLRVCFRVFLIEPARQLVYSLSGYLPELVTPYLVTRRPSLQTRFVSLGSNPFCISAGFLHSRTTLLFLSSCVYYMFNLPICQPIAFNNPTTHRTIATPFIIICGRLATR
jgi:hypothetical protein